MLHSEDYRARYADNLTKELPRIPCVKKVEDFRAFAQAGRDLAELHVGYETVEPYPVTFKQGHPGTWVIDDPQAFYRVTKMKFAGKRPNLDKSTVIYNVTGRLLPRRFRLDAGDEFGVLDEVFEEVVPGLWGDTGVPEHVF